MTVALCAFALVCFLLGPLLAHFELVVPLTGFGIFAAGGLMSLIASIAAIVAMVRGQAQHWPTLLPTFAALALFVFGASRGIGVPRINDITTDTIKPPQFKAATKLPANRGRDMSYPREFAAQQEAGYGSIKPLVLQTELHDMYIRVIQAARSIPTFNLTLTDRDSGIIEGTDTSFLFRFQDDFVIEIRVEGENCAVHMRSKSRDGKGDLGANAARIRTVLERIRKGGNMVL